MQAEFDLFYKKIYYAGIWASNVNFCSGPSGQDLADMELDYYVGVAPTVGKWNFNLLAVYTSYPGAFDPGGEFSFVEILDRRQPQPFRRQVETDTLQLLVARIFR